MNGRSPAEETEAKAGARHEHDARAHTRAAAARVQAAAAVRVGRAHGARARAARDHPWFRRGSPRRRPPRSRRTFHSAPTALATSPRRNLEMSVRTTSCTCGRGAERPRTSGSAPRCGSTTRRIRSRKLLAGAARARTEKPGCRARPASSDTPKSANTDGEDVAGTVAVSVAGAAGAAATDPGLRETPSEREASHLLSRGARTGPRAPAHAHTRWMLPHGTPVRAARDPPGRAGAAAGVALRALVAPDARRKGAREERGARRALDLRDVLADEFDGHG